MNSRLAKIGRTLALVVIIQLLIVSFALAQPNVREVKLPNGLTVLLKESHAAPVFTAQIWFKVGSRCEHQGITGISHMLEHMLFASSKHYKKGEISKMVHERGGIDNAATWTDFTYYWDLLSSQNPTNLEFAIKTMAEKAGNALLLSSEFQKERVVVLSELEGDENDPDTLLYEGLMAQGMEQSGYHWPTIGYRSDVEHIEQSQLAAYYRAWYHPNNATMVLVGDFNSDAAVALVKKYFSVLPNAKLPRQPYTTEPIQHGERRFIIRKEGTAERVMMGYHVPSLKDPDAYPLTVLDQILSGGRSSRLYRALVDTRMATSAWSSAGNRTAPALFMLGATARQGATADQLEKVLLEQVEKAKTTLPTEAEMQAAKNQLEAYFVYQNDSVSDQGEQLGYYNTVADWRYLQTLVPKIKAVTPEQVRVVAKKYFSKDNLTVGTFIPTGPATGGGEGAPAGGALRNSKLPGLCFYRADGRGQRTKSPESAVESRELRVESPDPAKKVSAKAGIGSSSLVKPYRTTLGNGIVLIVQENHSNPTVAVAGSIKAGSVFAPASKRGVADLVADVVTRGTTNRNALQIAQASENVGAEINVSADVESTDFTAKSLSKDLPTILDLLSDEFQNANFPEDQVETQRGRQLSSLEESKESPESMASRAFYNAIFPQNHPYHEFSVEQAEEQLKSITRDDLVSFYKQYYRPDTMTMVIAGDVDPKKTADMVNEYFGRWNASGPKPVVDISTVEPPKQGKRIVIPMMDKSEVNVIYGYPLGMKRSNPDFYAFRIANQVLGGSGALTSVLGEDIREKNGLVYDVRSGFDATLGAGPWYASLGSNPANVDKAIDLLKKEVEQFKQNGATKQQFNQAKEFVIGVFPIALETNSGVARMLLSAEFYGLGPDYLQKYPSIYRAVTLEQANTAARKYLHPESATLVIAGPYKEKKQVQ